MNDVAQWVVIGFGIILAIVGLLLFLFRQEEGSNRLKLLGQEVEVSKPGLFILVLGCFVVITPLVITQIWTSKGGGSSGEAWHSSEPKSG